MILFKGRQKCILCNKYHRHFVFSFAYRGIGICKDCYDSIKTAGDKSYESGPPVDYILSPFEYSGDLRQAVKQYKFNGQRSYGRLFSKMLCHQLAEHTELSDFDCVMPIPLHESRLMERGYNQSEILAEELAAAFNLPCYTDAVFRIRETKRQSTLKGIDRIENVKSAFYASDTVVSGKRIILVDDIYTMGQTMSSCGEALKLAGADKIIGIAFCKTPYKEKAIFLR